MNTNEPLAPLDDDLRALLHKAQSGAPALPVGLEDEVLARVRLTNAAGAVAKATTMKLMLAGGATIALVVAALAFRPQATAPSLAPGDAAVAITPVRRAIAPVAPVEGAPVEGAPVEGAPVAQPSAPTLQPSVPAQSEGELLERARSALARGEADAALTALQTHQHAYARGELVEERRALTVVAYMKRGDHARARSAARAFLREYPSSLFADTVRAVSGE